MTKVSSEAVKVLPWLDAAKRHECIRAAINAAAAIASAEGRP